MLIWLSTLFQPTTTFVIYSFSLLIFLQQCNYQASKEVVHELEFGDIASCKYKQICTRATRILILIGSLGCLKEAKTMNMLLGRCKFPNSFPYCCRYTFELPHRGNSNVYLQ